MARGSWARSWALLVAIVAFAHAQVPFDSISAADLIGDYFGLPFTNATFDYVIVGGGTAGLAMANRLSENCRYSVAVIEAGGWYEFDNGNQTQIPGFAATLTGTDPPVKNNLIDWNYQTTYGTGLKRSIFYSSGKTFGGGSARNYMVYTRGTKGAYQQWADQVGDQSYTFDKMLPYFQKSVNFGGPNNALRFPNASVHTDNHDFGLGGPVQVSYPNWANPFDTFVADGLSEMGFKKTPNTVNGDLIGQGYAAFEIDAAQQTRSSSSTAYLRPALRDVQRKLTVYKSTLAKRILFDSNKTATGVVCDSAGSIYTLSAKREVILSAGVHRSPQLLMVSGIGPKEVLDGLKVPVLSDLQGVGQNLQDQPFMGASFPVGLTTHTTLGESPLFAAEQLLNYRTKRTGMLTNPGSDYLAWEKLPEEYRSALPDATQKDLAGFPSDWPELLYTAVDAYSGDGRYPILSSPRTGQNFATILLTLVATFSRGNVTINSTDTAVNPIISAGLIDDPRDQDVAVQGFKRIRSFFNTTSVRRVIEGPEVYPGANVTSDADILAAIQNSMSPIWHASCTNKMGLANDTLAVVDSQARVFGVKSLRVVDASAFPFLPPQHPSSLVYALAEKIAAEMLK